MRTSAVPVALYWPLDINFPGLIPGPEAIIKVNFSSLWRPPWAPAFSPKFHPWLWNNIHVPNGGILGIEIGAHARNGVMIVMAFFQADVVPFIVQFRIDNDGL